MSFFQFYSLLFLSYFIVEFNDGITSFSRRVLSCTRCWLFLRLFGARRPLFSLTKPRTLTFVAKKSKQEYFKFHCISGTVTPRLSELFSKFLISLYNYLTNIVLFGLSIIFYDNLLTWSGSDRYWNNIFFRKLMMYLENTADNILFVAISGLGSVYMLWRIEEQLSRFSQPIQPHVSGRMAVSTAMRDRALFRVKFVVFVE